VKTAIVAAWLVATASTALAQWNTIDSDLERRRYERGRVEAESDLSFQKSLRDLAGTTRNLGGPSDARARERLERECIRALERGVENSVRRSYGCSD
jgi:hypothetical protein